MKNIAKIFLLLSAGILSLNAFSDDAYYEASWQWNKNVSIEKIQVLWDTSDDRVHLSNGEICRISKSDNELFAAALAMRAQGISGELVCEKNPISGNDRRLHRLTY